jgi:glycosyltransferase involved in cell wall biosynthesis
MLGKSKRILIFSTAYKPLIGGSEIALEQIVRHLPNVFFDIITIRFNSSLEKKECAGNYCVYRLGFGGNIGKFFFPLLGFFKGLHLYARNNYSLIQAYQASQGAGAAWLLKIFKPQLKFILTLQEGKELAKQNFLIKYFRRLIIRKADFITVISRYLQEYSQSINPRVTPVIIPNGVAVEKFKNARPDENLYGTLGIKKEDRVIISVSRLVNKNGLADLISSVAAVKRQIPQIKLVLIGRGPLLGKLRKQAESSMPGETVIFLGEIRHEKLPEFLKIADVFVRPSLSEGLGNSFLEAMAAGVPVIGTAVGGIPDFLIDGKTGLICEPRNPADLAEKIIRILSDHGLREQIKSQALKLVEEKYNWATIARQFEALYAAN